MATLALASSWGLGHLSWDGPLSRWFSKIYDALPRHDPLCTQCDGSHNFPSINTRNRSTIDLAAPSASTLTGKACVGMQLTILVRPRSFNQARVFRVRLCCIVGKSLWTPSGATLRWAVVHFLLACGSPFFQGTRERVANVLTARTPLVMKKIKVVAPPERKFAVVRGFLVFSQHFPAQVVFDGREHANLVIIVHRK